MDLRRLLNLARAWLPLIVAAPLLAGATAFAVSSLQQKTYEGRATIIVGQSLSASNPDYTQLLVAQGLAETYASIAKTRPIMEAVIEELGLEDSPGLLGDRVRVEVPAETSFLIVYARDPDPAQAAAIANEVGNQLIAASPAIQGREGSEFQASVDADLAAIRSLIESTQERHDALANVESRTPAQEAELGALEERLISLRTTYATLLSFSTGGASNILTVVEPAAPPTMPVAPTPVLNTLLAAILALLAVAGVAFLSDQLDDSVKDADTIQEVTQLSTLGAIARMRGERGRSEIYRLVTLLYPRSSTAESYRTLRTNVEFAAVDAQVRTLLVTSASPGEGKTVTAANLAVVFAQAGRRVLLVDADLRRPAVHRIFDVPNTIGLTTMLRDEGARPEAVVRATEQANLFVLTTGPLPPNPAELLGSHRMQLVLESLRQHADMVIFDSPPLQAVTDAAVLSTFVDGTILVLRAGHTRRGTVRRAREALARAGANVLGAVLNQVTVKDTLHYPSYYGEPGGDSGTTPVADEADVAGAATPTRT